MQILYEWLAGGHKAALATVITTWGSAPRPVGSMLVVRDDTKFEGSVSGGCVENAVIEAALSAIEDNQARDLSFGISDEDMFAIGLACGGTIRIYVEPFDNVSAEMAHAIHLMESRRSFERRVTLGSPGWTLQDVTAVDTKSDLVALENREVFRHVIEAPLRLFIFGAVHIAQHLATIATMAEYDVTVIDPRKAFASIDRFGAARMLTEWPQAALRLLDPDGRTAIVMLTHDAKLDDPALIGALRSKAFYIAALGSRRTQGKRRERLVVAGFEDTDLDRIHGPAGLAIGALSPVEIAISIMAELTAVRRNVPTTVKSMRE